MTNNKLTKYYCTPCQLKLPLEVSHIIDIKDPVYSFREIMDRIDLKQFFVKKGHKATGRPGYDPVKMLKIVLFAFMEGGYESLRNLEKSCKTDIRYMWLLDGMSVPSFVTFGNFIRDELTDKFENIFRTVNKLIFDMKGVDLNCLYIDGTKLEANANRYSWVWKKSCETNRKKLFGRISLLLDKINNGELATLSVKLGKREEYAIEYLEEIIGLYAKACNIQPENFVSGNGKHRSIDQRHYQELESFLQRLKNYAQKIKICGDARNSYSKTDPDATFMRVNQDYMGNDQLLPAYNTQMGICDGYIAVVSCEKYASDMDCFVPLIEKYHALYGKYPEYPVADAGYGSFNNYLYCKAHGMGLWMKFPLFDKTVKDGKYRDNPYRAVNFKISEDGSLTCPNGKHFSYLRNVPIKGNKYGREELFKCESCEGCPMRSECHKCKGDRIVSVNRELTQIHKEVVANLKSVQGVRLRTNRDIQSEGTFGVIKWDRTYKRVFRRGMKAVILELMLVSCGFNLYKYHNNKWRVPLGKAV